MKPIIIANWKMNPPSLAEAKKLFNSVNTELKKYSNLRKKVGIIICPPFVYLPILQGLKSHIRIGAQDCFWEESGAFTGEVSPQMLKSLGCKYVIAGHSERRKYFGETDEIVNKKIKIILEAKLSPIFCVGESWKERKEGSTQEILKTQIEKGLIGIKRNDVGKLVLAYEPVWAIGTGKACLPSEAQTMGLYLKKIIARLFSASLAKKIPIIYGGSVTSKNAKDYVKEVGLDGLLVGGASLNAKEFIVIVKSIAKA